MASESVNFIFLIGKCLAPMLFMGIVELQNRNSFWEIHINAMKLFMTILVYYETI